MRRAGQVYLGIALLTAVHPGRCGNECDFYERCQGNVWQTCGEGVDQCWNRQTREEPCSAPNDVCASDGNSAVCARSPVTRCGGSFERHCEGTLLLECSSSLGGFVVATDCSVAGRTCGPGPGGQATCVIGAASESASR